LVATIAWISSTITTSTLASVARAADVSIRYSDSGVVMRMSAGRRARRARSLDGVSPVRTAMVGTPGVCPSLVIPSSGTRRLRSTSTARALSGET
jgi:hypothetical protein